MKKTVALALCMILSVYLSACTTHISQQNNTSSEISQSDNTRTLIRALTATDTVEIIQHFEIIHEYSANATVISDKNDLKFLEKYTHSHMYPSDKLHELFLFPDNYFITIKVNGYENKLHLMKDGNIAIRQMCGDNGVIDIPFEVYTADSQYILNRERLIQLLIKYDGYDEATK